jgi:mannose/cellobiose epimerase-like protein (N-acyl-D-glucosamine 2-epimerase family)
MSPPRNYFTQAMSLMGRVDNVDAENAAFTVRCRSGDVFRVDTAAETQFTALRNIDGLDRDRFPNPAGFDANRGPAEKVRKYIHEGALVAIDGVYIEHGGSERFDARIITLMYADQGQFFFEDTQWWLTQIARFADEWLDDLFDDRRDYDWDDFAKLYRTNLNIMGLKTDDNVQECATLSRLIYGLSSAYLLTGGERYRLAARAGVKYQRETFRSLSHDGKYCFWMFGKRKRDRGQHLIVASENSDDLNTIPLYEQIYALAGLCQYYRISQSREVLEDVRRTVRMFQDFYRDTPQYGYGGTGGYFSHIDYASLRPDVDVLGDNRMRKNWNSIGDHIPAYLINLILALDPLPNGDDRNAAEELLETCREILDETSSLIHDKFPDDKSKYVNERFHADWSVDHAWRWQQNRAVVGHNLKIAWNMTRVAHYYRSRAALLGSSKAAKNAKLAKDYGERADRLIAVATRLADDMAIYGIDQIRGGCFDVVEREPGRNAPLEFTWGNTKDFWQQEQAILAYLIVYGATRDQNHLDLAREMMAFWNHRFLDHDNRGVFFRVTDAGHPVIQGAYAQKAGHAVAGYHSFELNYLAHTYLRSYVRPECMVNTPSGDAAFPIVDQNFCLFFYPDKECAHTTLNVLPDFLPPGAVRVASITINGVPRASFSPDSFQIQLEEEDFGTQIVVEFCPMALPSPPGGQK